MMEDPLLVQLRERFRETSRQRLEEIAPLLDAPDEEGIRALARHFHAFAGLGATYGFPRVSELGDEGESSILPVLRGGEELSVATLAHIRELCRAIERALEDGEPMEAVHVTGAGPRRILAVEDDETQAMLLAHILGTAGYEIAVCTDAEEASALLTGFAPDLLLTDVHLARDEHGGYDLVRRVREDERFRELPVIFVSADDELASLHGDPLVRKPVDWTRLLSLIHSRLQ